jgi:NOL1/NOP2/fmu family ribosome biogenesis protein
VYAWPINLVGDFNILLKNLRVIYSGTIVGELMRDKLVPHHALAMSGLVNETISTIELNYEQAIEYLQKKDLKLQRVNTGWQLVTFRGHELGWVNVLPGRINNYYPKELRILKES